MDGCPTFYPNSLVVRTSAQKMGDLGSRPFSRRGGLNPFLPVLRKVPLPASCGLGWAKSTLPFIPLKLQKAEGYRTRRRTSQREMGTALLKEGGFWFLACASSPKAFLHSH